VRIRFPVILAAAVLIGSPLNAETVRVASYNLRNYTATDRVVDKAWTPDYPKPEEEKDALRAVILAVRPDVIVFEEMGPPAYVEELRLDLERSGLLYPYSVHFEADDKDRCLAALSKIPFEKVNKITDMSFTVAGEKRSVKRGLLSLSFTTKGRGWTLYGAHIKSRYGLERDAHTNTQDRCGEAMAIRNRIQALEGKGTASMWILVGDMNDTPGSGVWNRLTEKSDKKLGVDLRPTDSHGEAWTYYYKAHDTYERIDMLLASGTMAKLIPEGGAKIFDGPEAAKASDHRLVYTDIVFPDGK
jgi:endonuclease/exonuclease/phosphatase family metal-dependent hydrolase